MNPREAPAILVIFGATGDLTHRKLLPALYNLTAEGRLHSGTRILGFARRDWTDETFRQEMREGVETHSRRRPEEGVWDGIASRLEFLRGNFTDDAAYETLARRIAELEDNATTPGTRLFYLATPPGAYLDILSRLDQAGLLDKRDHDLRARTRVIVEKPFGHDLSSARELNARILGWLLEEQVFRIDHYLGKETVQNLLVFRLDNGIFEPLWNGRYVDHVQITAAESVGVGTRGGYYEDAGVARDMLQNHLLQLLTLVAMEPPARFDAKSVRDEKVKVLQSLRNLSPESVRRDVVRGQYTGGVVDGEEIPGYRQTEGVAGDSRTETFLAARLCVDNWRWGGTPFYLRSGKTLPKRATEIAIVFKAPPHEFFDMPPAAARSNNVLRIRVQPEEGISIAFDVKAPGQKLRLETVKMDFKYSAFFGESSPEAYERLLIDALNGDSTLFARNDEVELSWELVDRIVEAWNLNPADTPEPYAAGTWGPKCAEELLARDGRSWLNP